MKIPRRSRKQDRVRCVGGQATLLHGLLPLLSTLWRHIHVITFRTTEGSKGKPTAGSRPRFQKQAKIVLRRQGQIGDHEKGTETLSGAYLENAPPRTDTGTSGKRESGGALRKPRVHTALLVEIGQVTWNNLCCPGLDLGPRVVLYTQFASGMAPHNPGAFIYICLKVIVCIFCRGS